MSALTAMLARDHVVPPHKLDEAIQRQVLSGGDIDLALLELGVVDEDTLTAYAASANSLVPIRRDELFEATDAARGLLSRAVCESLKVMPVREANGKLVIAVATLPTRHVMDEITRSTGRALDLRGTIPTRLALALVKFYRASMPPRVARIATALEAAALKELPTLVPINLDRNTLRTPNIPAAALAAMSVNDDDEDDPIRGGPTVETSIQIPPVATGRNTATASSRPTSNSMNEARTRLISVDTRDGLVDILLDFAATRGRLACLFVLSGDIATGVAARGPLAPDVVRALKIPLDVAGVFASLRDTGDAVFGLEALTLTDRIVLEDMGRPNPAGVVLTPVTVGSRVMLVLWLDRGPDSIDTAIAEQILALCNDASTALARLVLERKRKKGDATASTLPSATRTSPVREVPPAKTTTPVSTPPTGAHTVMVRPTKQTQSAPPAADPLPVTLPDPSLEPELTFESDDPPEYEEPSVEIDEMPEDDVLAVADAAPAIEPVAAPVVSDTPQRFVPAFIRPTDPSTETPTPHVAIEIMRNVPLRDDTASTVTNDPRATIPQIASGEQNIPSTRFARGGRQPLSVDVIGPLPERAQRTTAQTRPIIDPRREPDEPGASPARSFVTRDPSASPVSPVLPASGTAASPGASGENVNLIADVLRTGVLTDSMATALLGAGERVLASVFRHFPGPTAVRRLETINRLPAVADVGPLLRLVVMFRFAALPHLQSALERGDPDQRYFATLCLAEVVSVSVLPQLLPQLFDADDALRKLTVEVLRVYRKLPEFDQVLRSLRSIVSDGAARIEHRKMAAVCLGEFRDADGVPALLLPLGDRDQELAGSVHRAVVAITRQDFGFSLPQWREWYERSASRHRIEWLIEALLHSDPLIRHEAGEELKKLSGQFFGYYFNLPRRERERAWQRYREWWQTKGREQFAAR